MEDLQRGAYTVPAHTEQSLRHIFTMGAMKESLVSAGKDVSQKAKEVSGVAKLKLEIELISSGF